ncbi:MAG: bifunctional homocysteine S-methyltransferase/methylenetetrahydrofolate reductase [Acidobacteria bacterium]|nr:bifunctional homocysteine S-methyltransferase/methylenetetrahydrofolate reductase [Acidobacteriota bacterium]
MKSFLEAIDERVLVCDGAMGTMLYAKGVFINQCFDALNLTAPGRVAEVHGEYVRAGADVIETNTFGANRIKLRGFGLADRLREINVEGARLARSAAGNHVYVAGAIGPLGIRIEPWGRTGKDEAEAYFREQAEGLVAGGVDLFVLETFRDITELRAAIAAIRSICALPVVAQMTIEEDGNSLDGTPPEQFTPELESYADVVGVNCSIGPAPMLETVERMAAVSRARLSAQPNAGRPRDVDGRNIYLSSPEYMASYARRFMSRSVRLVGGCCGTTPEHIRQIKMAVKASMSDAPKSGRSAVASSPVVVRTPEASATVVPLAERSRLARALSEGRFATIVELRPPKGCVSDEVLAHARALKSRGVDVVHIPDASRGARMSALSLAVLLQEHANVETVLQYSCRDRNLLNMQSDLLGAHAMGIRNVMLVTGDVHTVADYPDATVVFDVDSVGLTNVVTRLNQGLDVGGQPIGRPTSFHVGVLVNPAADDLDREIRRFEYKVEAGAEFAVTRPVFDPGLVERFLARVKATRLPIILGLWPFDSALNAEFMANEVPGTRVPEALLERMRRAEARSPEAAVEEGVVIAREIGRTLRGAVQGVHVASPSERIESVVEVLTGVSL